MLLVCLAWLSALGACDVTPPADATTGTASADARAAAIKALIAQHKEWTGGHSPVPGRAITATTFARVRAAISAADIPPLVVLLNDGGTDVRSLAAALYECVNANAEPDLDGLIARETDTTRRNRLMDARIAVRAIRAGGTSCK